MVELSVLFSHYMYSNILIKIVINGPYLIGILFMYITIISSLISTDGVSVVVTVYSVVIFSTPSLVMHTKYHHRNVFARHTINPEYYFVKVWSSITPL